MTMRFILATAILLSAAPALADLKSRCEAVDHAMSYVATQGVKAFESENSPGMADAREVNNTHLGGLYDDLRCERYTIRECALAKLEGNRSRMTRSRAWSECRAEVRGR